MIWIHLNHFRGEIWSESLNQICIPCTSTALLFTKTILWMPKILGIQTLYRTIKNALVIMWKKEAVIVKFVLLKPCRMNQSLAHFIYRHNPSFPSCWCARSCSSLQNISFPLLIHWNSLRPSSPDQIKDKGMAELHHLSITKGQFASRAKAADAKRKSRWDILLPLMWYCQKKNKKMLI